MKRALSFAFFAVGLCIGWGQAAAQEVDVAAPVRSCIDENAPNVEKAIVSLTDATTFLVENVCADVVATEQNRQVQAASQKQMEYYRKLCAAEKSPPPKAASSDEAPSDPCAIAKSLADYSVVGGGWTLYGTRSPEPGPMSYAAKLLLSLRLAHMNSGARRER